MKSLAVALLIGGLAVSQSAIAKSAPSSRGINNCDSYFNALRDTPQVMRYASTGQIPSDGKPEYPRAWYMAALGLKDQLREYLEKHPQQVSDPDLLLAATYTGREETVAMLLQMGADPNKAGKIRKVLPLQYAAECERPMIMLYLLQAGANLYGTTDDTHFLAIVGAIVSSPLQPPFADGVKLILAAGFDPRCPVTEHGLTAVAVVNNGLKREPDNPELMELKRLLSVAAEIAAEKHPKPPNCGGLNWWPKK